MTGGRVLVIGVTGRNFAAGMSGGIAYVLDEDGGFKKRCNMGMVEFEPLNDEDKNYCKEMVQKHVKWTGSPKGGRLLADWAGTLARFVKVMPVEYRKVLAKRHG